MKAKILGVTIILLFFFTGLIQYHYDSRIDYFSEKEDWVALPSGKVLEIVSFGFKNLLADLLFIWSIQFYSNYNVVNRFDYLEHIYDVITDLNPEFKDPYIVGAWIMALEFHDYNMAIRLLTKGSKAMPDEWLFECEAGFYAYKFLKNYTLAEKFYQHASQKPEAPEFLKRHRAHMTYLGDNLFKAYTLWEQISRNAKTQIERESAFNHLYQIKYEIDKQFLERKINEYKIKFGTLPKRLEQLQEAGLISRIPNDYRGHRYLYDDKAGKIKAMRMLRWKRLY